MPDVQTRPAVTEEEPLWIQRMRAQGYDIRNGTLDEPLSETPEAFFYPPPRLDQRIRRRLAAAFRRIRTNASLRSGHAPLS